MCREPNSSKLSVCLCALINQLYVDSLIVLLYCLMSWLIDTHRQGRGCAEGSTNTGAVLLHQEREGLTRVVHHLSVRQPNIMQLPGDLSVAP